MSRIIKFYGVKSKKKGRLQATVIKTIYYNTR